MQIEIERLNDQGEGICFVDNKICFVPNTVIGDIIDLKITTKGSKFYRGSVNKIIKESPLRIKSYCPFNLECGGCSFSTISINDSLTFKKNKLEKVLNKFGGIKTSVEIIPSPNHLNYRDKITLHVKDYKFGYYKEGTNDLISINECKIASIPINNFLKILSKYNFKEGSVVIRSNYNDELLIHFIGNSKVTLVDTDLKIVGILQNNKVLMGQDYFIEVINDNYFVVSFDSFFQINRDIASILFDLLDKYILKNKTILDLYCGVGTLGLSVAKKESKVYGIEIIKNAILNSVKNAKINR